MAFSLAVNVHEGLDFQPNIKDFFFDAIIPKISVYDAKAN